MNLNGADNFSYLNAPLAYPNGHRALFNETYGAQSSQNNSLIAYVTTKWIYSLL